MKAENDIKTLDYLYRVTGSEAVQAIMRGFQPLEDAAKLIGYGNLEKQLEGLERRCIDAVANSYKLLLYNIDISVIGKPLVDKIKEKYNYEIN